MTVDPHASPPARRPAWHRLVPARTPGPDRMSRWPWWVVMAGLSVSLAFFFTVLGFVSNARTVDDWLSATEWARWFGRNLVVALTIGSCIQGLFSLARLVIDRPRQLALRGWRRVLFFIGLPMAGTFMGWPLGMSLAYGSHLVLERIRAVDLLGTAAMTILLCAVLYLFFSLRYRQLQAEMRASDAQLRLLQGQMEPHFLFNTLANVISLIDADAPRAKHVLEAFTDYLRASLGSLRRTDSTLGAELELATRFLALMQARMGERLRYELDVPETLRTAALPPLLLQPLVENAVKHGLEPQVDGGTVRVRAREFVRAGVATLELSVEDDGIGLAAAARRRRPANRGVEGNGIALANLRERLATLFGDVAAFTLAPVDADGGTRASIVLPLTAAAAPARGRA